MSEILQDAGLDLLFRQARTYRAWRDEPVEERRRSVSYICGPTAMMVAADSDPVLPVSLVEGMDRWVPDLRLEVISDCGHWTQQEQPEHVNRLLVDFLGNLRG